MKKEILDYIAACEKNIAAYKLIEDREERQRALKAGYAMLHEFQTMLHDLNTREA